MQKRADDTTRHSQPQMMEEEAPMMKAMVENMPLRICRTATGR